MSLPVVVPAPGVPGPRTTSPARVGALDSARVSRAVVHAASVRVDVAILVVTADGDGARIRWANTGVERLLGYAAADLVGTTVEALFPRPRWAAPGPCCAASARSPWSSWPGTAPARWSSWPSSPRRPPRAGSGRSPPSTPAATPSARWPTPPPPTSAGSPR
ncbi:PAS domain-containing protein [Klenkia terrae]|uniref:PAS domain-containing protein n=1 Tax=Klenkia terrae TaxID=1052259 RepID=UPI003610C48F